MRTAPVNQSAGPLPDGREPARLISISMLELLCFAEAAFATPVLVKEAAIAVPSRQERPGVECSYSTRRDRHLHRSRNVQRLDPGIDPADDDDARWRDRPPV